MRVGIIGKGNVGTAIGAGLTRAGHQAKFRHRDPKEPVVEAAKYGDVVFSRCFMKRQKTQAKSSRPRLSIFEIRFSQSLASQSTETIKLAFEMV
jgi:ketopantoate reductase